MAPSEEGTGGLGLKIIDLVAYFYADDGLVVSTQPERLKRAFGVLTGLFNWVILWKNTANTVGMVCQSCHTPGGGCRRRPMHDLPSLFPKTLIEDPVPDSGVLGRGVKLDQPSYSLWAPPRAG